VRKRVKQYKTAAFIGFKDSDFDASLNWRQSAAIKAASSKKLVQTPKSLARQGKSDNFAT
jgi:hypothetical protein